MVVPDNLIYAIVKESKLKVVHHQNEYKHSNNTVLLYEGENEIFKERFSNICFQDSFQRKFT